MDGFCPYCGRLLKDGEICTCKGALDAAAALEASAQPAPAGTGAPAQPVCEASPDPSAQPQPVPAAQPGNSCDAAQAEDGQGSGPQPAPGPEEGEAAPRKPRKTGFWRFFADYMKSPAQATAKVAREKNAVVAVVSCAVFWLALTILFVALIARGARLASLFSGMFSIQIRVSVLGVFLSAFIMTVVILGLSLLSLFAILKIMKVRVTFGQTLVAMAAGTTFPTLCILAASALLFVSLQASAFLLLLAAVAWTMISVYIPSRLFGAKDSGLYLCLSILFFTLVFLLSVAVGARLAVGIGRSITVNGMTVEEIIRELIGEFGGYGMSGGMGSSFGGMMPNWG